MALNDTLSLISKALNPTESIQVQRFILELNAKVVELESKNAELKRKITDYDKWEQEKKNYESHIPGRQQTLVYRKKGTEEIFCANCYEAKNLLVHLQPPVDPKMGHLWCPNCKTGFDIS